MFACLVHARLRYHMWVGHAATDSGDWYWLKHQQQKKRIPSNETLIPKLPYRLDTR